MRECACLYVGVYICGCIHAEVVTRVAGSLEAGVLPGYPESLFVEINVTVETWVFSGNNRFG